MTLQELTQYFTPSNAVNAIAIMFAVYYTWRSGELVGETRRWKIYGVDNYIRVRRRQPGVTFWGVYGSFGFTPTLALIYALVGPTQLVFQGLVFLTSLGALLARFFWTAQSFRR